MPLSGLARRAESWRSRLLMTLLPTVEGESNFSKALTATKSGSELWEPIATALEDKDTTDVPIDGMIKIGPSIGGGGEGTADTA